MNSITVIILMALSPPFPAKDSSGMLCQQILCRTFDNRYVVTIETVDSAELKYYTNTLATLYGDTVRLDSSRYVFIERTCIDSWLQVLYDDDMERYNTLRAILMKYTPNISYWTPCIYYNTDDDGEDDEDGGDIGMIYPLLDISIDGNNSNKTYGTYYSTVT